jgi:hypothetical protein
MRGRYGATEPIAAIMPKKPAVPFQSRPGEMRDEAGDPVRSVVDAMLR